MPSSIQKYAVSTSARSTALTLKVSFVAVLETQKLCLSPSVYGPLGSTVSGILVLPSSLSARSSGSLTGISADRKFSSVCSAPVDAGLTTSFGSNGLGMGSSWLAPSGLMLLCLSIICHAITPVTNSAVMHRQITTITAITISQIFFDSIRNSDKGAKKPVFPADNRQS